MNYLDEMVGRFPENPEIRLLYASILLIFRPDDVAVEAAKAIELGPDDPTILVRAAHLLFNRGEVDLARTAVTRAGELVEPDFVLMSGLVNIEGLLAARDGRVDVAEEKLRSAVRVDPAFSHFAVDLAQFLSWRGRQAEAIAVIDEALPYAKEEGDLQRLRVELTGA